MDHSATRRSPNAPLSPFSNSNPTTSERMVSQMDLASQNATIRPWITIPIHTTPTHQDGQLFALSLSAGGHNHRSHQTVAPSRRSSTSIEPHSATGLLSVCEGTFSHQQVQQRPEGVSRQIGVPSRDAPQPQSTFLTPSQISLEQQMIANGGLGMTHAQQQPEAHSSQSRVIQNQMPLQRSQNPVLHAIRRTSTAKTEDHGAKLNDNSLKMLDHHLLQQQQQGQGQQYRAMSQQMSPTTIQHPHQQLNQQSHPQQPVQPHQTQQPSDSTRHSQPQNHSLQPQQQSSLPPAQQQQVIQHLQQSALHCIQQQQKLFPQPSQSHHASQQQQQQLLQQQNRPSRPDMGQPRQVPRTDMTVPQSAPAHIQSHSQALREDHPYYVFGPIRDELQDVLKRAWNRNQNANTYWRGLVERSQLRTTELESELQRSAASNAEMTQKLNSMDSAIQQLRGVLWDRDATIFELRNRTVEPTTVETNRGNDDTDMADFVVVTEALSTAIAEKDKAISEKEEMAVKLDGMREEKANLAKELAKCQAAADAFKAHVKVVASEHNRLLVGFPPSVISGVSHGLGGALQLSHGAISNSPGPTDHSRDDDGEGEHREENRRSSISTNLEPGTPIKVEYIPTAASLSPALTAAVDLEPFMSPKAAPNLDLTPQKSGHEELCESLAPLSPVIVVEDPLPEINKAKEDTNQLVVVTEEASDKAAGPVDVIGVIPDHTPTSRRTVSISQISPPSPRTLASPIRQQTLPMMKRKREESVDVPLSAVVKPNSRQVQPPPTPGSITHLFPGHPRLEPNQQDESNPKPTKIRKPDPTPPARLEPTKQELERSASLESGELRSDTPDQSDSSASLKTHQLRLAKIFDKGADQMFRCRLCKQKGDSSGISTWSEVSATRDRFAVLAKHSTQMHPLVWADLLKLSQKDLQSKPVSRLPQTSGRRY
ncbi:hypothetical protein FRB93_013416 [Tulasnella sp. JGI-2019a]|nr:hypothetical protein FRB93_013416 [Tulasnella sp. JGI-2019a]